MHGCKARRRPAPRNCTHTPARTWHLMRRWRAKYRGNPGCGPSGGRLAPELLQALIPAAVVAIELVADRVLLVVALVVLLRRIERGGGDNLGDDRRGEPLGCLERLLRFLGQPP